MKLYLISTPSAKILGSRQQLEQRVDTSEVYVLVPQGKNVGEFNLHTLKWSESASVINTGGIHGARLRGEPQ